MPSLTVEIPDALYEQFHKLASDMERTVEECHVWAIKDFLADERLNFDADSEATADVEAGRFPTQEQMEAVSAGIKDADEGRLISHEEVMEWARSLVSGKPLPAPVAAPLSVKLAS